MNYSGLPWSVDDLDFSQIDVSRVRHHEDLFFLVCTSSFIETGSDTYTRNLVTHFEGNEELQIWLNQHWEPEELQHGRALRSYIHAVWPEFDWQTAFDGFWKEYGPLCTVEQLEPNRGLELAARCVVETGTAAMYRAINTITDEPVLRQLTNNIKSDEVRHYKHFYHFFRDYRERDKISRYKVFGALARRVNEIRSEDGDIALRAVFNQCYPQHVGNASKFKQVAGRAQKLLRRNLPTEMTVKMLLKPLDLPPKLQSGFERPLIKVIERFVLN